MKNWNELKNILLVRLDNMGDVIMSNAAFDQIRKALPAARLTLWTSERGAAIAPFLGTLDEVISCNPPWMKEDYSFEGLGLINQVELLAGKAFDGCIFFSVFSQNITSAALLTLMAGIPLRAGYCRENPYNLLTHWIIDEEPSKQIYHQIDRDLLLLQSLGIPCNKNRKPTLTRGIESKLDDLLIYREWKRNGYILVNADASEEKRKIDANVWRKIIFEIIKKGYKVIFSGQNRSQDLDECTRGFSIDKVWRINGETNIADLLFLVENAKAIVSVNTGTAHIACAYKKPILVIYARTNPQHLPWNEYSDYFLYDMPEEFQSKNQVVVEGLKKWHVVLPQANSIEIIMRQLDRLLYCTTLEQIDRKELIGSL